MYISIYFHFAWSRAFSLSDWRLIWWQSRSTRLAGIQGYSLFFRSIYFLREMKLWVCLCVSLSRCVAVCLSTYVFLHLSLCVSFCLCIDVYLSDSMCISLSRCMSLFLDMSQCCGVSLSVSVCLAMSQGVSICLCVSRSVSRCLYLSRVCLSIAVCLCVCYDIYSSVD